MFRKCELTSTQREQMATARTALMISAPFFAHYYYSEMKEHPTKDIPTAATDGRRLFYNPDYLGTLKDTERVFVLAHEVWHAVMRHPTRCRGYQAAKEMRGLPYDHRFMNVCMDYVINAGLIEQNVGTFDPAWLYHPGVGGDELAEDVYEKLWKTLPPPPVGPGGSPPNGGSQGSQPPGNQPGKGRQGRQGSQPPGDNSTFGKAGKSHRGQKEDKIAQANGGGFDDVLPPEADPVTGEDDLPGETEYKEAIARAAAAAKAMGSMPANLQRMIDEILQPKVNWREHIRLEITGKLGLGKETWDKPNRRRVVLSPFVYMPGKKGFGADTVAVAFDTSGSIGQKEFDAWFAEVAGILQDVRPKRVVLMDCDARVHQVREARSLEEFDGIRMEGAKGGGGTSFVPVFEKIEELDLRPQTLIYLTDMLGTFPKEAPAYPVIWCATTDAKGPFGDTIHIQLD